MKTPNLVVRLCLAASTAIVAFAASACDDSGLIPASYPNYIDTVVLHALQGTPIAAPSGFDIAFGIPARTDKGDALDFAVDIDANGQAVILPAGALGLTPQAGLQVTDKSFEEVEEAPYDEYVVETPLGVSVNDVLIGRSRNTTGNCYYYGSLPRYGKFRVLEVNVQDRTITLEFLVNVNCGYRRLEPGYPKS